MIQGTVRTGRSKVNGFIIGQVIVDMTGRLAGSPLEAHFALAIADSMTLFGKTVKNSEWSPATLEKLREFLKAVENDIARDVLDGEGDGPTVENTSHLPIGESGIPEL